MDGRDAIADRAIGCRRSDVARQVDLIQRQAELFHEVLERERRSRRASCNRAFGPFDAVFDLLQESSAATRSQAEAIEDAARALERVASLMKLQAELFERTLRTLREPAETVKTLAGGEPAATVARRSARPAPPLRFTTVSPSRAPARAPRRGRGRSRG